VSERRFEWSQRDLDGLAALYWAEIAPVREAAGFDPERDRPSYRWLVENGFGGLQYALQTHHDTTVKEFFVDVVGVGDDAGGPNAENGAGGTKTGNGAGDAASDGAGATGYDWGIDHAPTRERLDDYLGGLEDRGGRAETTVASTRSRLATYARRYAARHGEADLLSGLADEGKRPAEIERVLAALDDVAADLSSDASRLQYLGDVRRFYAYLRRRGYAAYNPLEDADEEFPWERSEPDNPALSAAGVRGLLDAADAPGRRLLVVGLAGWGLRPSELAALHRDQVVLDADDPHLRFEDRKNGPGTVSLLYGLADLAARLDDLADDPDWNGHLFPSARSASGHVTPDTIRNRFTRLAREAGVRVDGEVPTPKMGRRFWYGTYVDATAAMLDRVAEIADDQGSASPEVVIENYLSESRRRAVRRRFMRRALEAAFEGG